MSKRQPTQEVIAKETQQFHSTSTPELKESLYVHEIYNEIAPHFSQTRYKPWPIVEKFLTTRVKYSVGIDVGCGNGKYLKLNPDLYMIGSDYSTGLISCASEINLSPCNDLLISDGLTLPHDTGFADFAISILVIHHFSTPERRVLLIREILRCLRRGGELLVYCWALEQENSRRGYKEGMDQDILVPWVLSNALKALKALKEPKQLEQLKEDIEPVTKMRYYHMYKKGELVSDCELAGGEVVQHGYERDNWWCIVRKL